MEALSHNQSHSAFEAVSQGRQIYREPDLQFEPDPQHGERHPWFFRPSLLIELNGFDLRHHMAELKGQKVEVGGPTRQYDILVLDGIELPADLIVTNYDDPRHPELPRADAAELPYPDHSLGALFSSALPVKDHTNAGNEFNLRHAFLLEAKRCLEPGGILVGQHADEEDVRYAMELGFTPVRILESEGSYPTTGPFSHWDYVMTNNPEVPGLEYTYEALTSPDQPASNVGDVTMQTIAPPPSTDSNDNKM